MNPRDQRPGAVAALLLCSERSGSNLLRCMVDAHPRVYAPNTMALGLLCASSDSHNREHDSEGWKAIRDEVIVPHDQDGTPHERNMNATIKAHGDLLASPEDLAKFTIELMKAYTGKHNELFSQKTAKEMLKVSREIKPEEFYGLKDMGYGCGAFILGGDDTLCFMHPGSNNPGTSSMLIANPRAGKGAVIMTNGVQGMLLGVQMVTSISLVYDWPYDVGTAGGSK